MSMWWFTRAADWWDERKHETEKIRRAFVEDLIKATGRDPGAVLGGMESGRVLMKNLEEALKSAGAEVCTLPKPATIAGVTELAKKKRSAGRASRSGRRRPSGTRSTAG